MVVPDSAVLRRRWESNYSFHKAAASCLLDQLSSYAQFLTGQYETHL